MFNGFRANLFTHLHCYCFDIIKCFLLLLSNANNSIDTSNLFAGRDLVYKYCYLIKTILLKILVCWLQCKSMSRENWVQPLVESNQRLKKFYLIPTCLTLSIIRDGSRVKWSKPGKGVTPSTTFLCSSY